MEGLNPYSIGIWSATVDAMKESKLNNVLILILLEYGLRPIEATAAAVIEDVS